MCQLCHIKGWVQCYSMQVVMNKCFLNPEKRCSSILSLEKNTKTLFSNNDVTDPKARLL